MDVTTSLLQVHKELATIKQGDQDLKTCRNFGMKLKSACKCLGYCLTSICICCLQIEQHPYHSYSDLGDRQVSCPSPSHSRLFLYQQLSRDSTPPSRPEQSEPLQRETPQMLQHSEEVMMILESLRVVLCTWKNSVTIHFIAIKNAGICMYIYVSTLLLCAWLRSKNGDK